MDEHSDAPADETSFFVRDTLTLTSNLGPAFTPFRQTADLVLYSILALAQHAAVDFLPITYQSVLGNIGTGATTTVNQCFVGKGFDLAFKEVGSGLLLLHELAFVCSAPIRLHPFMVTLQGICWDIADSNNQAVIKPALVFEKSRRLNLWSFMHTEEGKALATIQRLSFCVQMSIALEDLEGMSKTPGARDGTE
jgi:hypothetical protein